MYIDTERKFSSERLLKMAKAKHPQDMAGWQNLEPIMTRILVMTPDTAEALQQCLQALQTQVTKGHHC